MKKLDIEFAFEGFRIISRRPMAVLAWGVVLLIVNVAGFGSFIPLMVPAIEQLAAAGSPDPTLMPAILARMILPYFILLAVMIIGGAVVSCAIFRTALDGTKGRFGNLRLGGDEVRMIVVHLLFAFVFFGIYLACLLAGGVIGGGLGVALNAVNEDLVAIGVFIGIAVMVALMIWILLRLSLFAVQSFAEKTINLFGSWKLTKGNSWTLLGGYLLAFVLAIVVETVAMFVVWIVMAVVMVANMGAMQELSHSAGPPQFGTVMAAIAPMLIAYVTLFSLFVQPLMTAILVAPSAAAYRALSGRLPAAVEKIF
jgi:hypothetical protein